MRTPLLYALVLLAFAGGAWLLWGEAPPSTPQEDLAIDVAAEGAAGGQAPLTAAPTDIVGVWGHGAGTPGGEVDFAEVEQRKLTLAVAGGHVTGQAILDTLAQQLGRDLPIRFTRPQDLARFRTAHLDEPGRFPEGAVTAELHLPDVLEIVRALGYEATPRTSFLLLTPHVKPARPPSGSGGR